MHSIAMSHPQRSEPNSPTDEQLACQAQAGSRAAFDELARRFGRRLHAFCLRRCGRHADAEDIAQQALTRAFQKIDLYQPRRPFGPWLFSLTRRLIIDHHRRIHPTATLEPQTHAAAEPDPATRAAEREAHANVWHAAARLLSDDQQTALWLRYVEDMDIRHIARSMERSQVSVKVMLLRARRKLAEHLLAEQQGGAS